MSEHAAATVEQRLADRGYDVAAVLAPMGSYVPAVRAGDLVFVSGHAPVRDGQIAYRGKVGVDVELDDAREAARLAVVNALAGLRSVIGELSRVERVVKLLGFVNCAPDFDQQPQVIDAASDLLHDVFGDAGLHARAAVGAPALPAGITVEIELVAQVRE